MTRCFLTLPIATATVTAVAAACVVTLSAAPADAQLLDRDTERGVEPSVRLQPAPPPEVDTTGVWYHIRRDDRAAADRELRRLEAENPGWQPPDDLLGILYTPVVAPVEATPAAPLDPMAAAATEGKPPAPGDDARLAGWTALGGGEPAAALASFDAALAAGAGRDAALGRLRALLALGRLDAAEDAARRLGVLPEIAAELAGRLAERAQSAAAGGDLASAVALTGRAASLGVTGLWEPLGWTLLDAGDATAAADAFARAGSEGAPRLGRALALARAGQEQAATDLACAAAGDDPRLATTCRDLLVGRAGAAAAGGDWSVVLAAADRLDTLGLADATSRDLRGWALLNTGNAAAARDVFAAQHRADPTTATAEGLLTTARAAGEDLAAITARVTGPDDPLGPLVEGLAADVHYSRGLYTAANALAPDRYPELGGIDEPYAAVAYGHRDKDGDPGRGRIAADVISLLGGATVGGDHLTLGLDLTEIENDSRPPLASGDTLWEPRVTWTREGLPLTLTASLGTTPLGAAVSPLPVGSLGARWEGAAVSLSGTLFAESRRDSLLALGGQKDPASGLTFGRVVETGAEATVTVVPAERLGVTAEVLASYLTGQEVANNTRLRLGLSSAYDLAPEGFAYLRAGPYVSWQHYANNLSQYTFGHGGYYSPQYNVSAGLAVDAMTLETGAWLVGLRASVGYTVGREAAARLYPDGTPAGVAAEPDYGSVTSDGLASDLALRGGLKLTDHWMLTGLAAASFAPDYEETLFTLGLRTTFGGGRTGGILARDLPEGRAGR